MCHFWELPFIGVGARVDAPAYGFHITSDFLLGIHLTLYLARHFLLTGQIAIP